MKPGDQVGKYLLLKELGHGGMGGVFVGFDSDEVKLTAIKTLFEEYASDDLYVRRFLREVDVLSKLNHPNIVQYLDSGVIDRIHYIVLEHIRGRDLSHHLEHQKRFSLQETLSIVEGVASALGHAHAKGVVHRDIKPSNIMLTDEGRIPKIVDFGVAYADDSILQTATGDIVGTFMYSAPEQNQGKEVDERSDLYALGLVFYECLTGRRALQGNTHQEVTTIQLTCQIPPPSEVFSGVPSELDPIVLKLLAYSPDDRFQGAEDLLFDLEIFKNNPKAFAQARQSIYDYPEFLEDFKRAAAAYNAKNYDLATEIATALSHKAPKASEIYFLLGQIQFQKNFLYNAIREYKKAITFDPNNVHYHMQLAATYESLGMLSQAKVGYQTILELEPTNTVAEGRLHQIENPQEAEEAARVEEERRKAEEEAKQGLKPEDVAALKKRLMRKMKPYRNPFQMTLQSAFIWGLGFFSLEEADRGWRAIINQAIFMGLPVALLTGPANLFGVDPETIDPFKLQAGVAGVLAAIGAYLFVTTLAMVREHSVLFNQRGYVIELDEEGKRVVISVGASRDVKPKTLFWVFQQEHVGDHRGVFVGELHVEDVRGPAAAGRFYPQPGKRTHVGDFVVAKEAVRQELFDANQEDRNRFLNLAPELFDPAHVLSEDERRLIQQATTKH